MSRMNRTEVLEILKRQITNEIVVAVYSTAAEWIEMTDRPLNYFSFGAMGLGSSHGLGLALARPERKTVVFDGDGSLLMNFGTLVTIGKVAPKNFVHFVFKNQTYEANGGHPIPNEDVDFAAHARAAHYRSAETITDIADFEKRLPLWLKQDGPTFVCLEIAEGAVDSRDYADMYKQSRRTAMKAALMTDT